MKKTMILLISLVALVGCTKKLSTKEVKNEFKELAEKEYKKLKDANSFLNVVVIKLSDLEKSKVNIEKIKNYDTNKVCNKEKSYVEIIKDKATADSAYKVKVTLNCK